jgi:hypothetical protein
VDAPEPNRVPASRHRAPPAPRARHVSRATPPGSFELPLPAVHRAALAITLGKPNDLRRLARDLQRAGQDIEAGLLDNYALLLERSENPNRDRLLAEVTRMLRAAAAERRSARRTTPAIAWPPTAPLGAAEEAARAGEAPPRAAVVAPSPPAPADALRSHESNAVVMLPQVTLGARRRASR